MHAMLLILLLWVAWPVAPMAGAVAVPNLPMPSEYVDDLAGVVNAQDKHSLNGILQELEQKTGVQYIILTIETTNDIPIEEFSITLAHNRWALGQAGKDNGLLFTLALKDRTYRFEVGKDLEGFITDNFTGRVGRDILKPYFLKGDYSRGIYEANLQVVRRIADEMHVQLTGMANLPQMATPNNVLSQRNGGSICCCPCCGFLLLLFIIVLLFGRGGRGGGSWWWLLLPFLFRGGGTGYHRGGYTGGPFGGGFGGFGGGMRGGGFGHFGGGGGGHFGGGGATGHW